MDKYIAKRDEDFQELANRNTILEADLKNNIEQVAKA